MPRRCCFYDCSSNFQKKEKITVFRFPKKKLERRKWLKAISLISTKADLVKLDCAGVCIKHWKPGFPTVRKGRYESPAIPPDNIPETASSSLLRQDSVGLDQSDEVNRQETTGLCNTSDEETILDEQELIEAVEARPQLYDKTDPKYSNREFTRLAWAEVAMKLNVNVGILRKRWSGLRDYFMRQVRLEKRAVREQKWPLFDSMGFLLPYVQSRNSPYEDNGFDNSEDNNLIVCKVENEAGFSASMQGTEMPMMEQEPNPEPAKYVIPISRGFQCQKRKHSPWELVVEDDSNSNYSKTSNSKEQAEAEEDSLFVKSLLPAMKVLSPSDRCEFRHEVQGLLLNYLRKGEQLKRNSHQEESG